MRTPLRQHARAERLREHAAAVERARRVAATLGVLVRAREARARAEDLPLEVRFARTDVDGRALPAAVWVALRRGDVDAAVEAMTTASQTTFVVDEREVVGEGYRLQSVSDTLPLPEADLLAAQVARAVGVPTDVVRVLAEWGADDPRTASEIDDLMTSRHGPVSREPAPAVDPTAPAAEPVFPAPAAAPEAATAPAAPAGSLTMTVADAAQVLRLDPDQERALATLVRNATITLTD